MDELHMQGIVYYTKKSEELKNMTMCSTVYDLTTPAKTLNSLRRVEELPEFIGWVSPSIIHSVRVLCEGEERKPTV